MEGNFDIISAKELDGYVMNNSLIVDLRNRSAYNRFHIQNAVNMPHESLEYRFFESYRYQEIILYCERGSVSMRIARELARKDFRVKTVVGGINAYRGPFLIY